MLQTAEGWRDRELVQAVLDHAAWGGGVVGITPTLTALTQGTVLVLVVDSVVLRQIPGLSLLADRHSVRLVAVQGPHAHGLRAHGGMGAILRSAGEQMVTAS
ncbi:MAG: hypothetical protein ACT4P5_15925 [Armatimonadota bacterium]